MRGGRKEGGDPSRTISNAIKKYLRIYVSAEDVEFDFEKVF